MIKKLLLFVFFCTIGIFAQAFNFEDTVYATTMQEFNVPSKLAYVAQHLIDFDFKAELLDANGNKLRDCPKFLQKPPNNEEIQKAVRELSHDMRSGVSVAVSVQETIEQAGTYIVKFYVSGTGENRKSGTAEHYFLVHVTDPIIAVPVRLRPEYYFGESESFSFATVEYNNINDYSYTISNSKGDVITQGVGSFIKLDGLLNKMDGDRAMNIGELVTIKGMYQGKEFTYKMSNSDSTFKSVWQFRIVAPEINFFSAWAEKNNSNWVISVDNDHAKQFLVGYMAKVPNGIIVVTPIIKNLRIRSDPENFVTGGRIRTTKIFSFLDITVNNDFLQPGQDQFVAVTFQFNSQFGTEKKTFFATVIK
jgi:hypothetical protein